MCHTYFTCIIIDNNIKIKYCVLCIFCKLYNKNVGSISVCACIIYACGVMWFVSVYIDPTKKWEIIYKNLLFICAVSRDWCTWLRVLLWYAIGKKTFLSYHIIGHMTFWVCVLFVSVYNIWNADLSFNMNVVSWSIGKPIANIISSINFMLILTFWYLFWCVACIAFYRAKNMLQRYLYKNFV
jgi:hypothetical protein